MKLPHIAYLVLDYLHSNVHMTLLRRLCSKSVFIRKLTDHGYFYIDDEYENKYRYAYDDDYDDDYDDTYVSSDDDANNNTDDDANNNAGDGHISLATLLQNLDIYESPDDVIQLLTQLNLRRIITKLGIERALIICDELGATTTEITDMDIPLDKVMDRELINTYFTNLDEIISAYNAGYKVIVDNDPFIEICNQSKSMKMINNASHNGMFIQSLVMAQHYNNTNVVHDYGDVISQSLSNDIMYIDAHLIPDKCLTALLQRCKNIEKIDNVRNLRQLPLSSMQNIRSITSEYIVDRDIELCTNLYALNVARNKLISSCAPFAHTLRILDVEYANIDDDGLRLCTKIKKLYASNNKHITTCEPFAHSLKILYAINSNITDAGLVCCTRIKKLYADDNPNITTCTPFAKTLRVLHACGSCGISDAGLKYCRNLLLYSDANNKISNKYNHNPRYVRKKR